MLATKRLASLLLALALALPLAAPLRPARADEPDAKSLLAKGQETEKGSAEEAVPVYLSLLEKFPKDVQIVRAWPRPSISSGGRRLTRH